MKKKIIFNKIEDNFVSEYELKIYNIDTQQVVSTTVIPNENSGPTVHEKALIYNANNIYFVDNYIYYTEFYNIEVFINGNIVDNINIEYNSTTKHFYINNVKDINESSKISVRYYKNIIEKTIDIPEGCDVIVKPILYKKPYVGDHNILY